MTLYEVQWDLDARKEVKALQKQDQKKVIRVAERRKENPFQGDVKKVQGAEGLWRVRADKCRVIFHVDELRRSVIILAVTLRRDGYPDNQIVRWVRRLDAIREERSQLP